MTRILISQELKNWAEDNKLLWYLFYHLRGAKLIEIKNGLSRQYLKNWHEGTL